MAAERPYFMAPEVERVLVVSMAIAQELAVARARIDTLERLLERKGVLTRAEIEAFRHGGFSHGRNLEQRNAVSSAHQRPAQDCQRIDMARCRRTHDRDLRQRLIAPFAAGCAGPAP